MVLWGEERRVCRLQSAPLSGGSPLYLQSTSSLIVSTLCSQEVCPDNRLVQSARKPLPAGTVSAFQELSAVVTAGYKLDSPGKAHFPWNVLENASLDPVGGECRAGWAPGPAGGKWEFPVLLVRGGHERASQDLRGPSTLGFGPSSIKNI